VIDPAGSPALREDAAPFAALAAAPRGAPLALLHPCGTAAARWFTEPVATLTVRKPEGAWERLQEFFAAHAARACVGYLGYDLRDAEEPLPRRIADDLPWPLARFVAYDRVREWPAAAPPPPPPVGGARELRAHTTRAGYEARVARVVEHIRAGDIFQANLTQPFTGRFAGDPRALFWRLCHASPAPFAAYLEFGDGDFVLSSSPEEFLWSDGSTARTQPIKGTRPRGRDAAEDRALLAELRASEKDQAELAMIVDLMRNDLGKVAVPGSVRVGPFPEHASFAQVHHLFARVTATLEPPHGIVDLLRATFPPGSITGAPKLRCMEILEELELVRRGVYTGAIGQVGPGPRLHLSVAIRTLVLRGDVVRFATGGGITADSDPGREFEETLHKAAGMLRALQAEIDFP
jgi:para-aminobenzoate synthetase component 1